MFLRKKNVSLRCWVKFQCEMLGERGVKGENCEKKQRILPKRSENDKIHFSLALNFAGKLRMDAVEYCAIAELHTVTVVMTNIQVESVLGLQLLLSIM